MQELAFFALPSVAGLAIGLAAIALSELGIQPRSDSKPRGAAKAPASDAKSSLPSPALPRAALS